jgi:anti-sigma B factor antagonist
MARDEQIINLALKVKFLNPTQLDEAKKLQSLLGQNGFTLSILEILAKKDFLNSDQMRLLKLGVAQEEVREEDQAAAVFMVKNGFLPEDRVREALAAQDVIYADGKPLTRIQDLLLQRGVLKPEQLQIIQRARQQLEHSKVAVKTTTVKAPSESSIPAVRPTQAVAKKRESTSGQLVEGCKVGLRKTTMKDATGQEKTIYFVDVEGVLDGHTFKHFDDFVNNLIDEGRANLILNCEKLDYVSSAGIGVLAGAVKRCRDANGDLRLCGVQEKVKKIINLVGLQSMLRMYDTDRGALASFKYM